MLQIEPIAPVGLNQAYSFTGDHGIAQQQHTDSGAQVFGTTTFIPAVSSQRFTPLQSQLNRAQVGCFPVLDQTHRVFVVYDQAAAVPPSTFGPTSDRKVTLRATEGVTDRVGVPPANNEVEILSLNPRQHDRIMKRRRARAKLVADGRIPTHRRPYQYESRHEHAMRRSRSVTGRFITSSKIEKLVT